MYILADMEWVTNAQGTMWPTQLSAVRVNETWQTVDAFSTLIRPKDVSFQNWNHMAFSGWQPSDFLNAPKLYQALDGFLRWMQPDDILCWWHQEAGDLFHLFQKLAQVPDRITKSLCLNAYVYDFLSGQERVVGSPYKLCAARDIPTPAPAHCSDHDVLTLQLLLKGIGFPQEALCHAPPKNKDIPIAVKGSDEYPLLYDPAAKLLHRSDCASLPEHQYFPAFHSYKIPLRRRYKPCTCCRADYFAERRAKNQDTITRSEYRYVYSKQSKVFHKRDCPYLLLAADLLGNGSYDACLRTGRRPCKHCNPIRIDEKTQSTPAARTAARPAVPDTQTLSDDERSAIGRFKRSKNERMTALRKGHLTEDERKNLMALSQPGLAFWASRGYQTFHRRNCPKIAGLNQLRGFQRYQDAVKAGYTPCRQCRPSPKQDVVFSIPITNEERAGESVETLIQLCTEHGLSFAYDEQFFTMQTLVGKWRIELNRRPVHLEHINFMTEPGNTKKFHTQPRLFLSLKDTFDYIIRHDSKLTADTACRRG